MADLKIEKKKKSPIIWVILGIIAVVVIAWLLIDSGDADLNNEQAEAPFESYEGQRGLTDYDSLQDEYSDNEDTLTWGDDSGEISAAPMSGSIGEFVSFAEETDSAGLTLQTTHEGLIKLFDALAEISPGDTLDATRQRDLEDLQLQADQPDNDQLNGQNSAILKNAFVEAANKIQKVQDQYYPEMRQDSMELMASAQNILTQSEWENQKAEIKAFFDDAAAALEQLQTRVPAGSTDRY